MAPSSPVVRRIVQIANYIPFVVVLFLFLFGYVTLLDIHIRHTWGKHHAFFSALLNILVATALVGGALGCFLLACFRDPGHPVRGDVEDGAAWGAQHTQQQQYEQRAEGSAREDGAGRLQSRHAGETSEAGQAAERFDAADEEDEDEEGPSAPLLSAPRDTPDARGTMALRMLPGAPRLPARTGRRQLDDVMALASIDGSQREGEGGARGKVKLADVQVKSSGERRWCAKCDAPKPDRAHHCSICKVCVLRMDHHCPWLASRCVGLRNHKAFFLFLFYTCLTCCFAAQDAARTLVTWVNEELDGFENSPISWAILLFTSFIFGIALIPFAAYHAWLICRNRTTLESMEGAGRVRIRAQPSAPGRESVTERLQRLHSGSEGGAGNVPSADAALPAWRADAQLTPEERKALKRAGKLNIYNVGVHENWCAIMGRKWYLWFLPVGRPDSDGFSYAVDVKTLRELQRVTEGIRVGADAEPNARGGTQSRSNTISSIRGRAREASTTDVASSATRKQQPLTQADIASGRIPDTRGRKEGQRTKSAHGVVEWGKPPKRDFVLYGVSDDEDEEGALRSTDSAAQEEEGSDEDGLPRRTESASQADAEVWR